MFKAICACGQASIGVTALPTDHGICHCTNMQAFVRGSGNDRIEHPPGLDLEKGCKNDHAG